MNRVITFGEIMLRLSCPDYLRISQSHNFEVSFAGAEANVAVSLANYGVPVSFISRYPDNDVSKLCLSELRSMNVDVNESLLGGERLGLMYLEKGSMIRPSKITYDRSGSSFATICPGLVDWKRIFKDAGWFHWTGITPALSSSAAETCLEAIKYARDAGLTVSCDLNYRKNLWKEGRNVSEIMNTLVALSDIIIGNEEDCGDVFNIYADDLDVEHTNGEIDAKKFVSVCRQMQERFPRSQCLALTLRGAINANNNTWQGLLYAEHNLYISTKYDLTHIVDRVGSGDAFAGGLIYALFIGKMDWQCALDFAVAASALKHSFQGDFNRAGVKEVFSLMKGDKSGRVKR